MDNSSTKLYNVLMGNPSGGYNAIGRTTGMQIANGSNPNFFQKRWNSIENAVGTTLAAPASWAYDNMENMGTQEMLDRHKNSLNDIYKKYGYDDMNAYYDAKNATQNEIFNKYGFNNEDFWNQRADAEAAGDTAKLNELEKQRQDTIARMSADDANKVNYFENIQNELKSQANVNANEATKRAKAYDDYRKNNYISQKINQDRGKFAGSAINTLSTGFDALTMASGIPVGVLANSAQGGIEGVADELEQNGFENFDWGRAGQNAAIGAASGAVAGAINKGLSNKLAKNGGNLFKGGNRLTQWLNDKGANTTAGKVISTLATGAGRGAISGAAGGATGAGLSSAMNQADIGTGISNALQGAAQGAAQGAMTGATMAGANMAANAALNKVAPTIANKVQENQLRNAEYGDTLRDQFKGAWNSGDSWTAEKLKNVPNNISNLANKVADFADRFRTDSSANNSTELPTTVETQEPQAPVSTVNQSQGIYSDDPWDNLAQQYGYKNYDEVIDSYMRANPGVELNPNGAAGQILTWLDENPGEWNINARLNAKAVEAPEAAQEVTQETVEKPNVLTSKQVKAKRQIVKDIADQFEAVDAPTARATKPEETFYNIYENLGLDDGDDIRVATSYAEQGGLIPQMIREAAGEAGVIDLSDAQALIMDLKISKKNYDKYVNALEDIMESTDTTIVGGKSGVDALQLQRTLEQMASDARGTNGTYHIGNNVVDETMARNFQRIANNIGDKLDEAAVQKNVVQNVINRHSGDIQNMKNTFAGNEKWQNYVNNDVAGAQTIRDLRSSIKDLTRANIFIKNGDQKYTTLGGRTAARVNAIPTTKSGAVNRVVNDIYDKAINSSGARRIRLARNDKILNNASSTPTTTTSNTTNTTTSAYNPATQIYNMIGRNEGLNNGEQSRAEYLADTAQEAMVIPKAPNAGSLESIISPYSSTNIYNSLNNTPTTATTAVNTGSYFQPTGDYWTDILASALSSAVNDRDVTAFATLYDMYQDALSGLNKSDSSSSQKLTATQQRANAAMNSLERLSAMTPDTAYNLSNIPLIGNIATLGGNDYEAEAKSLAQQIGYMVSGSNIKDSEAENIGKSYVPQPWDNETVRKNKLNRAYQIIQQYQNGYAE